MLKLTTEDEASNGGYNRYLWACVRNSKLLPEGGDLDAVNFAPVLEALTNAVAGLRYEASRKFVRDAGARALWREHYPRLRHQEPGLLGIVTGRADAQTLRLSLVYAALDGSLEVRREHVESALALWDFCHRSARYVFGGRLANPLGELIAEKIREAGSDGLARSRITRILDKKHVNAERGALILQELQECNRASKRETPTAGRTSERWYAPEFLSEA